MDGTATFDGTMAENLFYGRELSEAEVVENDLYMQRKWGKNTDNTKAPGGVHHGLSLWLDASDTTTLFKDECSEARESVSTGGESVRCWQDKSSLGNHVEAAAGAEATYTTGQANGRALLDFCRKPILLGVITSVFW